MTKINIRELQLHDLPPSSSGDEMRSSNPPYVRPAPCYSNSVADQIRTIELMPPSLNGTPSQPKNRSAPCLLRPKSATSRRSKSSSNLNSQGLVRPPLNGRFLASKLPVALPQPGHEATSARRVIQPFRRLLFASKQLCDSPSRASLPHAEVPCG